MKTTEINQTYLIGKPEIYDLKVGDEVVEYKKDQRYESGYFEGKVIGKVIAFWNENNMVKVDFGNNQEEWIRKSDLKKHLWFNS